MLSNVNEKGEHSRHGENIATIVLYRKIIR
jgi:hypothetical protein